jgi:hypothetical protein
MFNKPNKWTEMFTIQGQIALDPGYSCLLY